MNFWGYFGIVILVIVFVYMIVLVDDNWVSSVVVKE